MTVSFVKAAAVLVTVLFPLVRPAPIEKQNMREMNGNMHRIVDDYNLVMFSRTQNRTLIREDYGVVWKSDTSDMIGVKIIYSGEDPNANAVTALEPALWETGVCQSLDCRNFMCVGWCDISALGRDGVVENLKEVSHIIVGTMPEANGFTGSGTVKTQAIAAMQINTMLRKYPELTGKGVKIGIISDSFNLRAGTLAGGAVRVNGTSEEADIKSGNLPGGDRRVKVLNEPDLDFSVPVNDEGRVMAQLIYDLVPDAEIVFSSGFLNIGGFFASAIEALVDDGCDVIVDDLRADGFEPIFQLGPTPQAADEAANVDGVAYFTVARNLASRSWETRGYKDTSCPDNAIFKNYLSCHDFGNGGALQRVRKFVNTPLTFYWDDPWTSVSGLPGPQSDLDIFAVHIETGELLQYSATPNAGGDAVEKLYFDVTKQPQPFNLVIAKRSGPSPLIIKWIDQGLLFSDPPAEAATLTGIGLAPGVAAVGAAPEKQVFGQMDLEFFSSRGGIPLIFDHKGNRHSKELVLHQPRFVAPDGSYNTFFGTLDPFELSFPEQAGRVPPRFFGTSCSVTNAAALGVILIQAMSLFSEDRRLLIGKGSKESKSLKASSKSAKESKSFKASSKSAKESKKEKKENNGFSIPFDVYKIMEDTSIDMNEEGYDFLSGFGFLNALAAVEMVVDKTTRRMKGSKSRNTRTGRGQCPVGNFLDPIESYFENSYEANANIDPCVG